MEAAFKKFFGYAPRQFQKDVADSVLSGAPTILRAPTGYGKTAAAQFPFLFARQNGLGFPRQMIYSLPLRVLANSLYKDAIEKTEGCGLPPADVRIQTGEFQQDALFLGDLTFTTYDQLLAGFLHLPLSLPSRLANVLAGAALSSYLTFDEVHLMEMSRALGTTVAMLHWMKDVTPALLMTATLTDAVLEWLQDELNATVIQLTAKEIEALPRARCWHREPGLLNATHILEQHNGKRTIVVANTVDGAQRVFTQLREYSPPGTSLILLHSRFFQAHRKQKEEQLLQLFGKNAQGSAILVATQVIEVGLNISCDNLHTEVAPASSLIQRAGRCARFVNESGDVWVYDVESALPYTEELRKASDEAESALWNLDRHAGYGDELNWVEEVHGQRDKAELISVRQRKMRIFEVIANHEQSAYRELIREVNTLSVLVTPAPEELCRPWDLEGLSILPGTLKKHFGTTDDKSNLLDDDPLRWFAKKPRREEPEEDAKRGERREPPKWEWLPVTKPGEFDSALLIALNPRFVSYSFDLGLRFEPDEMGESGLSPCVVKRERERYSYVRETYFQHIFQVWKACERHFIAGDRLLWAARRLETRCGLNAGDFDRLMRLVVALHDVGKLGEEWQDAVWGYQKACWGEPMPDSAHLSGADFLAHTHYDPSDPRQRAIEKKFPRPPHGAESAVLTQSIWESLGFDESVAFAGFSAVARHHSPFISRVSAQKLSWSATDAIEEAAHACGINDRLANGVISSCRRDDKLATNDWLLKPEDDEDAYLLYLLLVRALRISDQFSFEEA